MATLAAAQAAASGLTARLERQPWFHGVTLAQCKCYGDPAPYELLVEVSDLRAQSLVPLVFQGVKVQVAAWSERDPLGDLPVTQQDAANVFIGFAVLFGGLMVGKIVVGSILEARREHFERQGQTPEAVKAKETAMDGVIKVVAFALSVNELVTSLPEVLSEAKKYLP